MIAVIALEMNATYQKEKTYDYSECSKRRKGK